MMLAPGASRLRALTPGCIPFFQHTYSTTKAVLAFAKLWSQYYHSEGFQKIRSVVLLVIFPDCIKL